MDNFKINEINNILKKFDSFITSFTRTSTDENVGLYERWIDCRYDIEEIIKRYKELEEQGLLLRLPCKVGDTIWCLVSANTKVVKCDVLWIEINRNGAIVFSLDGALGDVLLEHLGAKWFLSQEEAEKALTNK